MFFRAFDIEGARIEVLYSSAWLRETCVKVMHALHHCPCLKLEGTRV